MAHPSPRSSLRQTNLGAFTTYTILIIIMMLTLSSLRLASGRFLGRGGHCRVRPEASASFLSTALLHRGGSDWRPPADDSPRRSSWALPRGGVDSSRRSSSSSSKKQSHPSNLQVSVCAVQGFRSYMEDEYVVAQDFAAVFDGHGGKAVSKYLRQNLFAHLQAALPSVLYHRQQIQKQQQQQQEQDGGASTKPKEEANSDNNSETTMEKSESSGSSSEPTVKDYCIALRLALDKVDQEVQRISHWSYQGSTAVAAWLHHNTTTSSETGEESTETTLIVANVGDSRAVYGRNGEAFPLTRDHKPDDPIETERIEQAGGSVVWCGPYGKDGKPDLEKGVYRVNGNLALSRAVGDRSERPAVTAEPDITYLQVMKKTDENPRPKEYIILATDGLWDVFTNQEVVHLVDLLLERTKGDLRHQRDRISDVLVREALRRGTYDNVTVILIWLCTGDDEES